MSVEAVGDVPIGQGESGYSLAHGVAADVQGTVFDIQKQKGYTIFSGDSSQYMGISRLERPYFSDQKPEYYYPYGLNPKIIWFNFSGAQNMSQEISRNLPDETEITAFFETLPGTTGFEKMRGFLAQTAHGTYYRGNLEENGEALHIWLRDGRIAMFTRGSKEPDFYTPTDNSVGANIMFLS